MNDHTPGPWDIMFDDDVERIRLNGSSVYQVADVTDPDFPTGKPRYNLADLRLMAAAPALLAALKRRAERRDAFDDDEWQDVLRLIAKAEGRSVRC